MASRYSSLEGGWVLNRHLNVICLHLSALECLLVEEIHVAAVPDVIIIKHRVFYLLSKTQRESEREEGSTVHLLKKNKKTRWNSNRDRSAEVDVCSQ